MPDAKPKEAKAPKIESGLESDPKAEAKQEVATETEDAKDVESLKIQARPETVIPEAKEPGLEAPANEAETEEPAEEKKS